MTGVFDIAHLKPEGLHAVIKTTQLLSDLGEAMGWCLDEPVDLQAKLRDKYGLYKPQSGASLIVHLSNRLDQWHTCLNVCLQERTSQETLTTCHRALATLEEDAAWKVDLMTELSCPFKLASTIWNLTDNGCRSMSNDCESYF